MDDFKKLHFKDVGPGGMKCPCCAPAPGKGRKKLRRAARRSLRQPDQNLFQADTSPLNGRGEENFHSLPF